jgi:hypothetical protein
MSFADLQIRLAAIAEPPDSHSCVEDVGWSRHHGHVRVLPHQAAKSWLGAFAEPPLTSVLRCALPTSFYFSVLVPMLDGTIFWKKLTPGKFSKFESCVQTMHLKIAAVA